MNCPKGRIRKNVVCSLRATSVLDFGPVLRMSGLLRTSVYFAFAVSSMSVERLNGVPSTLEGGGDSK